MMIHKNMQGSVVRLLLVLLVFYFALSYTIGFQSDNVSRGLSNLFQVVLTISYLVLLQRKNPSFVPAQVLKAGVVFTFAISLLKFLFILICDFSGLMPVIDMLYEGYACSLKAMLESDRDLESLNLEIKSELTPTFLLIFVLVGTVLIGATISIMYYLILKTKSKWSYL